ncbi:MAG TPA: YidC/Oxa1 family membrane protein insertase [Candidatus Paceibacterota bacterium]|nr:YidC/Oxa1 family membrane protein insertase [Candidatus Paceibacterota bacterium]
MSWLFNTIIYHPLLNALVVLYDTVSFGDIGIAIVMLTVVIRLISLPLSLRTIRSQREMAELAPEIERIKEKHKNDQAAQGQAMMDLYKQHKVNPLAGCLPLLIQFPVLFGLYRVFINIFKPESLQALYSFVPDPGTIQTVSLGIVDLGVRSIPLAVAAGLAQFIQAKVAAPLQQSGQAAMLNKQMMYFFPVLIIVISWNLPAGLALYWTVTTLASIAEQWYIKRKPTHGTVTA